MSSDIIFNYIKERNLDKVQELVLHNNFSVNSERTQINKNSLLLEASFWGHFEIVKFLVENGANINYKNYYGNSALMCASENNELEIIHFLLENGADINIKNDYNETPLIGSIMGNKLDAMKLLLENGANINNKNQNILTIAKIHKCDEEMLIFIETLFN